MGVDNEHRAELQEFWKDRMDTVVSAYKQAEVPADFEMALAKAREAYHDAETAGEKAIALRMFGFQALALWRLDERPMAASMINQLVEDRYPMTPSLQFFCLVGARLSLDLGEYGRAEDLTYDIARRNSGDTMLILANDLLQAELYEHLRGATLSSEIGGYLHRARPELREQEIAKDRRKIAQNQKDAVRQYRRHLKQYRREQSREDTTEHGSTIYPLDASRELMRVVAELQTPIEMALKYGWP